MEILKKPAKMWGRFFDLIASRDQSRARGKKMDSKGKVSLAMGNEVLGEWLSMERRPLQRQ